MKIPRELILNGDRNSFIHRAFISWITQHGTASWDVIGWENLPNIKEFEINITIEGVEISYVKFMERIECHVKDLEAKFDKKNKDFDHLVKVKALELLQDKFNTTMEAMKDMVESTELDSISFIKENYLQDIKDEPEED